MEIQAHALNSGKIRYILESRNYAPPLCMLGLGKSGEGAYTRDPYLSV